MVTGFHQMNNIESGRDIVFQNIKSVGSIIATKSVLTAFAISTIYHVVLLLIILNSRNAQIPVPEFWLFALSDVAIWTLGLIPILAVWRGRLSWYDPFFLYWIMTCGTFSTVFLAVCIDPISSSIWMSYGVANVLSLNAGFYFNLFHAEIIILIFLLVLLATNQKIITYKLINIGKNTRTAALITEFILIILGIYGFIHIWGEYSFLTTVLSSNGAGSFITESGKARYILLQNLAVTVLPLGLVGWLSKYNRESKIKVIIINWVVITIIFCTFIPDLVTGSRLNILISFVTPIAVLRFFNFSIKKRMLGISISILIIVLLGITIIRGNEYTKWITRSSATPNIAEAFDYYISQHGSIGYQLLYSDRVGNIAFIVKYLNENNEFLYGQSLIAGFGNNAADLLARLRGKQLLEKPFLMANEFITKWRFGNPHPIVLPGGPVPPSIEGEFFMQGGYIALILFSYLLGRFFLLIRRKIATTRSFILKWFLLECLILMGFYFAMGEFSSFSSYFLFLIVALVIHRFIFLLLNTVTHRVDWNK